MSVIKMEEGTMGFFKGVSPRIIGQAPSAAISWATYFTIRNFIMKKKKYDI